MGRYGGRATHDVVFYDERVFVNIVDATFSGKRYLLDDITSTSICAEEPSTDVMESWSHSYRQANHPFILVLLLLAAVQLLRFIFTPLLQDFWGTELLSSLFSIALLVVSFWLWRKSRNLPNAPRTMYTLVLTAPSGRIEAVSSPERRYVKEIAEAIAKAKQQQAAFAIQTA